MSIPRGWKHLCLSALARLAAGRSKAYALENGPPRRLLILRRDGIAEMLSTLPLIWAIREEWPETRITVATQEAGRAIARMCPAINEVRVFGRIDSRLRGFRAARKLRGFDVAIAAKSEYDHDLARLIRLTNAPLRIGFESAPLMRTPLYFTATVDGARQAEARFQTLLRLAEPLGLTPPPIPRFDLEPGQDALYKARNLTSPLTEPVGGKQQLTPYVAVNISALSQRNWTPEQYADFLAGLAGDRRVPVAIVYRDRDEAVAQQLAHHVRTFAPVAVVPSRNAEELAAVLQGAQLVFTPSHDVALLAAAVDVPTLILWWQGDFIKLGSPHPRHLFLRADEDPGAATPTYALNLMDELWNGDPANPPTPPPKSSPGDSHTA
ncbi:MAG: glycosyltransferase family 9 protein [Verrucomicrobiota bacterium]